MKTAIPFPKVSSGFYFRHERNCLISCWYDFNIFCAFSKNLVTSWTATFNAKINAVSELIKPKMNHTRWSVKYFGPPFVKILKTNLYFHWHHLREEISTGILTFLFLDNNWIKLLVTIIVFFYIKNRHLITKISAD